MLTSDTKRKINACRDILVGKIPDPKGQIDQITNALVYKFMDDQDQQAIGLGGKPSFFIGDLSEYAWHCFFDARLDNHAKAKRYIDGLEKLSSADHLPDLFQTIFKEAYLPFRDPATIARFLGEINEFSYDHSEELGNAFEYLLSIMGSQGDAGQFRTPRHIIRFIVDVVDPQKDETIHDPACGTAGFLVEAFNHITSGGKLNNLEKSNLAKHVSGIDIDPGMAKIARVNLYLHGFKTPHVTEDDSLTNEKLWIAKYNVILANPPFMTPKWGINPHNKFAVKANRAEVLFTDWIAEHLKLNGRAGIIVPDGIIFQSVGAYKDLRKHLVEDWGLWSVVSLPAGVFQPYSGVKTSILFLDRQRAKTNADVAFVKVAADGYDLGAQRREIVANDLPATLEILNAYKRGEHPENPLAQYVERARIAEGGDYNLSVDRFHMAVDYSTAKWQMVELGKIAEFIDDGDWIESKDQADSGIRLVQTGNVGNGEYIDKAGKERYISNETFNRLKCTEIFPGDILLSRLPDPVGRACMLPKLGQRAITAVDCTIFRFSNLITAKYFVFLTLSKEYQNAIDSKLSGATRQRISKGNLLKINIPLPPLKIQEQIVAELDSYQKIISGARAIVENWKPKIEVDPSWERVKLGEIFKLSSGNGLTQSNIVQGEYPVYWWNGINGYHNDYLIEDETIVIGRVGAYCGSIHITKPKSWVTDNGLYAVKFLKQVNLRFIATALELLNINRYAKTGGQPSISQNTVYELEIFLPPFEIQKQIVEKIEVERVLVQGAAKLVEVYEQKTKDAVAKLWK